MLFSLSLKLTLKSLGKGCEMLIASLALLVMAPAQSADDLGMRRNAYSKCLRKFTDESVKANKDVATFKAEIAAQCKTEETAFKDAMVRSDKRYGVPAAETAQTFKEECADYLATFVDTFEGVMAEKPG